MLLGPACWWLCGLAGARMGNLRCHCANVCFVAHLRLSVGAGFDHNAVDAMLRWPLAFVGDGRAEFGRACAQPVAVVTGFSAVDRRAALLASAPGTSQLCLAIGGEAATTWPVISTKRSRAVVVPDAGCAVRSRSQWEWRPCGPVTLPRRRCNEGANHTRGHGRFVGSGQGCCWAHHGCPRPMLIGTDRWCRPLRM